MQCSNYGGVGHFAKKIPSPPQLGWKNKQRNFVQEVQEEEESNQQ